jgi:hypothetical protein
VPPHGVLEDEQIGAVESFDLAGDGRRDRAPLRGVTLLGLDVEAFRLLARDVVLPLSQGSKPMA